MSNERKVVITGVGPLGSTGIGKDSFWQGILDRKVGLKQREIKVDGKRWDKFFVHEIADFFIEDLNLDSEIIQDINKWKKGSEDKDLNFLLAVVKLAIDDSEISYDRNNNNIGLFLTVEHPGFEPFCEGLVKETIAYLEEHSFNKKNISKYKIFRYLYEKHVHSGYDIQTFMYLYFVARVFGLHGYSLFTNNACASGLFALESAARQIKCGESNIVILAGGDVATTMFKHKWFQEQGLYAEDGKMKPFSKNANGLVLGNGAAALVLENYDHAVQRKAHIYAEYSGGAFSLEGWKVMLPQIGGTYYQDAIKTALRKSNLDPNEIDLINPHGVALKATDAYEAKAISDIFGRNTQKPFISAFKPYVGHNLGGSAMLEMIILLLSMEKQLIPPVMNCDDVEPKYNIELIRKLTPCSLNATMKLSCGFAGYNAAAVFKKI